MTSGQYGPLLKRYWRHYKGNIYFSECIALSVDTERLVMVYKNAETGIMYTRDLQEFCEDMSDGTPRFDILIDYQPDGEN